MSTDTTTILAECDEHARLRATALAGSDLSEQDYQRRLDVAGLHGMDSEADLLRRPDWQACLDRAVAAAEARWTVCSTRAVQRPGRRSGGPGPAGR